MQKNKKALVLLIFGVILISFAAVFVKWSSIDGKLSSFYRTFYGAVSLFICLPFLLKDYSDYKFLKSISYYKYLFLAGMFLGVDLYLWHQSIHYIGAGLGTVVANSQVFFIAIISSLLLKERIKFSFVIVAIFAFLGIILTAFEEGQVELNEKMFFGAFLAIAAGFLYAMFLYFLKRHRLSYNETIPVISWLIATVFATITISILLLINYEIRFDISVKDHLILFGLGFFVQAIAWIAISKSMNQLNLFHVSMTLLGQPVLACFWGIIFFNESYHLIQLIGLLIALTMIILGQFLISNQNKLLTKHAEKENKKASL